MDIWVSPIVSYNGDRYFLFIKDDCSRFIWIFPLKTKDETAFLSYLKFTVEQQFVVSIKSFQTDVGTDFKPTIASFEIEGILHRLTRPCTSTQNGCDETRYRRFWRIPYIGTIASTSIVLQT